MSEVWVEWGKCSKRLEENRHEISPGALPNKVEPAGLAPKAEGAAAGDPKAGVGANVGTSHIVISENHRFNCRNWIKQHHSPLPNNPPVAGAGAPNPPAAAGWPNAEGAAAGCPNADGAGAPKADGAGAISC